MKTLLVEGWRGVNQSFALVNRHQLTHLAATKGLQVFHKDMPLYNPAWAQSRATLEQQFGGRIRPVDASAPADFDALYRIDFPFRLFGGPARRVFVLGTCETLTFPPGYPILLKRGGTFESAGAEVEVIVPSRWSRNGFVAAGFPEHRLHVIPHGIEPIEYWHPDRDEKAEARSRLGVPGAAFVFLNVSAMTRNKGIVSLLIAFGRHLHRYPQSVLLLKGSKFLYGSQYQARIREAQAVDREAADAALQSTIHVDKDLDSEELSELYRAADAYVAPYEAEGFNLPVLEAIASGLPVLVTQGGPTDDFCRDDFALQIESRLGTYPDGVSKHLEPSLDSLLAHMARVVDDGDFRAAAAVAGPEWAALHYSWRGITEQLVRLMLR